MDNVQDRAVAARDRRPSSGRLPSMLRNRGVLGMRRGPGRNTSLAVRSGTQWGILPRRTCSQTPNMPPDIRTRGTTSAPVQ